MHDLVLDLFFFALNRRRVTPLYTQDDAWQLTGSRPAHTRRVWLGDKTTLSLTYKLTYGSLRPWASSLLWVLGLQ